MKPIDLTRFDLNLLVVLHALLQERHVGRAADRLHLSQSATSHALSRLRTAFRDPLFVRHPKGIEPTPLATELMPRIAALLQEIGDIASPRGPFVPTALERTFRIGATDHGILSVLAPALNSITRAAPRVVLRTQPVDQDSLIGSLDSGALDLAIGSISFTSLPRRIEAVPVLEEEFVGIARRGHPGLRRRGNRHEMDLDQFCKAAHILVSPRGDARGAVDAELERIGRTRHIAATCPSFLAVPFMVGGGDLISVVARRVARRLCAAAGLVMFEPPIRMAPWTVSIVRAQGRAAEPAIAWLTDAIVSGARSG